MYDIKRVLVALDLTEIDDNLIDYVIRLSQTIEIDKVYFISVLKKLDLPEEIAKKYPDMLAPMDEAVKKEIEYSINSKGVEALKAPFEIDVLEGNVTEKILHWINVKKIDLAIVGNKGGVSGQGLLTGKIAKVAPCNVALIPEILPENVGKLVVPLDFSESSKLASELAVKICANFKGSSIKFLHVYSVPSGYHLSGKSHEEFAEIIKSNAQNHYQQFISKIDLKGVDVTDEYKLTNHDNIPQSIYKFAIKEHATGIVMGSNGRTTAASFIMGSIAEKLINLNTYFPLLIAKSKDHAMNLFDLMVK